MERHIEAWLDDLRTTDAPQCRGFLHTPKGYCCLGRLIEVEEQGAVVWKSCEKINAFSYVANDNEVCTSMLPSRLIKKYGLDKTITITTCSFMYGTYDDNDDYYHELDLSAMPIGTYSIEPVEMKLKASFRTLYDYAIALNDRGYTFKEIAAILGYLMEGLENNHTASQSES